MNKRITYAGLWNTEHSFNLYGIENINYKKSQEYILKHFKFEFEKDIKKALKSVGLKYIGLSYYSPRAYNYSGDSLDLTIRVINKKLFKKAILKNKNHIDAALKNNKSYDGYMALTVYDSIEELNKLNKPNYEPDIIVLFTILNNLIDFSDFNIYDSIVFDD